MTRFSIATEYAVPINTIRCVANGAYLPALRAAGIDHAPRGSSGGRRIGAAAGAAGHWTEESVLRTLRELFREDKTDLRHRAMKRSHHSLFWAAKELYGS